MRKKNIGGYLVPSEFGFNRNANEFYMRKKVLIITPFYHGIGGAETYCKALVEEAIKKHNVEVATCYDYKEAWVGTPFKKSWQICWRLLKQSSRLCWEKWPDTIHAQGLQAAFVGMLLRWIGFDGKLLVTILALYDFDRQNWFMKRAVRFVLNHYDKIFVEGETGEKDILCTKTKSDKIVKFMHWIDVKNCKFIRRQSKKHLDILFVGRPIWIKGRYVVKEVERWFWGNNNIRFTYIENMPHHDLIKQYAKHDILVVPSQYSEGFPRVIFEAAAYGCIIITSKAGALPELVRDFGLTFRSSWELYFQISTFNKDRQLLMRYQKMARRYAEKCFTPKNAEVIINEY
jgi:glycosyltransferase involved in cell wall biosynthesis